MKTIFERPYVGLVLTAVAAVLTLVSGARGDDDPPAVRADDVQLREGLAIAPVGRYGRSAIHQDAIEAQIVAGKWRAPKAGDGVSLPDGSSRTWKAIQAGDDGWFRGRSLGGGYVYFAVPAESEHVMLLDAAGHGMVYVNGEPRAGDPYSNGWVRVPVQLRAGTNDFLFHVARGQLRAKLVPPKAAAQFDLADTTLPDLIVGSEVDTWAAVPVINATNESLNGLAIEAELPGGHSRQTYLGSIAAASTRKLGFRVSGRWTPEQEGEIELNLTLMKSERSGKRHLVDEKQDDGSTKAILVEIPAWRVLDSTKLRLRVVRPDQTHKRTFVSSIDGSVQYFAVVPAKTPDVTDDSKPARDLVQTARFRSKPALILTLHGAGVEAIGQANAYLQKDWAHVVAPTNRRPYGFDWEDWGRLDAIEVLELAQKQLNTAPGRTYLTGHSMGGHGVWQIGAHFPDRFAAIGPSAGWVSMVSYAGARRPENPSAMQELLLRAASPSDTLALARNYVQHGVFVLHGEKDDNVPVAQARTMKGVLEKFHTDFAYHEEPGMGHWWGKEGIPGTACVDWPPMWEFFRKHSTNSKALVREIEFVTASPGVSAWSHWVGIEAQTRQFAPSSVRIEYQSGRQVFAGSTENVARLAIDTSHLEKGRTFGIVLDDQELPKLKLEENQNRIWLSRDAGKWSIVPQPPASLKGPLRYGTFKDAFRNRVIFVYGTRGSPEENAWSLAKARFDAETFWYRGNGSIDIMSDMSFEAECADFSPNPKDAVQFIDRNVIVYGNADSNGAWQRVLKDSPVQVRRGCIEIGDRIELGDDLACLVVRPRPGSDTASVGVVSGTGVAGMRLTDRLPYFVSGVAYPDCIVLSSEMLASGAGGVRAAGFFGLDWTVASGEFEWHD